MSIHVLFNGFVFRGMGFAGGGVSRNAPREIAVDHGRGMSGIWRMTPSHGLGIGSLNFL